jgi:histidinol phosphatase-like enzyme (inositol monophosphatase family)
MSPRLAFALDTAVKAGRFTLAYFNTGTAVELKQDNTPVTEADRGAERIIRHAIEAAYPGDAILGEEEGESGAGDARWVVDPIDGTKSFICGVPLYATLISYEVDKHPVLGVAYFPALDELLFAEKGQGAFFNGRPCHVSPKPTLQGAVVSCGSHASMEKLGRAEGMRQIAERTLATRTWSDAYGHALVATGRVEAMVDPIVNHWDVSAVSLIVVEAGGRFTDFDGTPGPHNEAIGSNGLVHDELLEVFKR